LCYELLYAGSRNNKDFRRKNGINHGIALKIRFRGSDIMKAITFFGLLLMSCNAFAERTMFTCNVADQLSSESGNADQQQVVVTTYSNYTLKDCVDRTVQEIKQDNKPKRFMFVTTAINMPDFDNSGSWVSGNVSIDGDVSGLLYGNFPAH